MDPGACFAYKYKTSKWGYTKEMRNDVAMTDESNSFVVWFAEIKHVPTNCFVQISLVHVPMKLAYQKTDREL